MSATAPEFATDEDGSLIRIEGHCRHCGALILRGYMANGEEWRVEFFASDDPRCEPHRDSLRGERQAAVLRAVPGLR